LISAPKKDGAGGRQETRQNGRQDERGAWSDPIEATKYLGAAAGENTGDVRNC
jgi:hypothetical protein